MHQERSTEIATSPPNDWILTNRLLSIRLPSSHFPSCFFTFFAINAKLPSSIESMPMRPRGRQFQRRLSRDVRDDVLDLEPRVENLPQEPLPQVATAREDVRCRGGNGPPDPMLNFMLKLPAPILCTP